MTPQCKNNWQSDETNCILQPKSSIFKCCNYFLNIVYVSGQFRKLLVWPMYKMKTYTKKNSTWARFEPTTSGTLAACSNLWAIVSYELLTEIPTHIGFTFIVRCSGAVSQNYAELLRPMNRVSQGGSNDTIAQRQSIELAFRRSWVQIPLVLNVFSYTRWIFSHYHHLLYTLGIR